MPSTMTFEYVVTCRQTKDASAQVRLLAIPIAGLYPEDWTVTMDAALAAPAGQVGRQIHLQTSGTFDTDYPTNDDKIAFCGGMFGGVIEAEFPSMDVAESIAVI